MKKVLRIKYKIATGVVLLVLPIVSFAWSVGDPIVPCGRVGQPMCNLCDLATLANNIVQFITLNLIAPLGTIVIIVAGIMMLTAGGNPAQIEKGKKALNLALVGILIAFSAYLIVDLIMGNLLTTGYIPFWNDFPFAGGNCELFK
ncbi:TrbC/VirB2 family protein [Patescibacteria group bacterium]